MSNDTESQLPYGEYGGAVDDSSVTQNSDSSKDTLSAKRPRVVPGGDDGSLQFFKSINGISASSVYNSEMQHLLQRYLVEARRVKSLYHLLLVFIDDSVGRAENKE